MGTVEDGESQGYRRELDLLVDRLYEVIVETDADPSNVVRASTYLIASSISFLGISGAKNHHDAQLRARSLCEGVSGDIEVSAARMVDRHYDKRGVERGS